MAKIEALSDIGSLANTTSARAAINDNFEKVADAFENTLSRDGSQPNQMEADIDLNDHYLLNVADPVNDSDGVNKRSVEALVNAFASEIIGEAVLGTLRVVSVPSAAVGQDQIQLPSSPGTLYNAEVFVAGEALTPTADFTLTGANADIIQLTVPLAGGEKVMVRYSEALASGLPDDPALRPDLAATGANKGADLVAFPDDVAPAFLKTVSDIINGERVSLFRNISKTKWAGIRARTNTDDLASNIEDLLDAMEIAGRGSLYVPYGLYHAGPILIPGNLLIDGDHSTIKAIPSLGAAQQLFGNKNFSGGAVNATNDNNITIRDLLFECAIGTDRTVTLVGFSKAGDLRLENVVVDGPKHAGILLFGSKRVTLVDTKVSNYGTTAVLPEGGSGIHITTHTDGSISEDIKLIRPRIANGQWTAITTQGTRVTIEDPHIVTVKEAGIFGTANGLNIEGGYIQGVTKKDISASGIELGGDYISIGGGIEVRDVDNVCIALTDTQNVNVGDARTINARRDAATFPTGCHISILSTEASPNMPRDIKISGHSAVDYSSPSTAAVRVEGSGAGSPVIGVDITDNNYLGTAWSSGKAVYINPTYWTAASCRHRDNAGNDDTATMCVASRSTAQALADATDVLLIFDAASPNGTGPTGTSMWVGGTPTTITCHETGRIQVSAQVGFAGAATGIRRVRVLKNGNAAYAGAPQAVVPNTGAAYTQYVNVVGSVDVVAGDLLTLQAYQDSGGSINTSGSAGDNWMSVRYLQQ